MSRKESRYCYWLIWCFLAFTINPLSLTVSQAWAQDFDDPTIGERTTYEVSVGGATLAQFQALQQAEIQRLSEDKIVQNYFSQNFDIDGAYGQLKDGRLVDDWEALAKTLGTTGAALAGAYAVWRRRRKAELSSLRSGDSVAVEALFETTFNDTDIANGTTSVPSTNDEWENWAKKKGLPGAGATIAGLYLLWRKRKEIQEKYGSANQVDDSQKQMEGFFRNIWDGLQYKSWSQFRRAYYQPLRKLENQKHQEILETRNLLRSDGRPKVYNDFLDPSLHIDFRTEFMSEWKYRDKLFTAARSMSRAQVQTYLENERLKLSKVNAYVSSSGQRRRYAYAIWRMQIALKYQWERQWRLGSFPGLDQKVRQPYVDAGKRLAQYRTEYRKAQSEVVSHYSSYWNAAYNQWEKLNEVVQTNTNWLKNLGTLSGKVQSNLKEQSERKNENFGAILEKLISRISASELESFINQESKNTDANLAESKIIEGFAKIQQLESQIETLKEAKKDIVNFKVFRDKAYAAQGVLKDSRGRYIKYRHDRYGRWVPYPFDTRYLDNQKIQKNYDKKYADQISELNSQIEFLEEQNAKHLYQSNLTKLSLDSDHIQRENTIKTLTNEYEKKLSVITSSTAYRSIPTIRVGTSPDPIVKAAKTGDWNAFWSYWNRHFTDRRGRPLAVNRSSTTLSIYRYFSAEASRARLRAPLNDLKKQIDDLKNESYLYERKQSYKQRYTSSIHQIKDFLKIIEKYSDHPYARNARFTFAQLHNWKSELANLQIQNQSSNRTWGEEEQLKSNIQSLENNIAKGLEKLAHYHQFFVSDPESQVTQSDVGADIGLIYYRDQYCCDPVYKFVEAQTKAKEFYKLYGQTNEQIGFEAIRQKAIDEMNSVMELPTRDPYQSQIISNYNAVMRGELPPAYVKASSWYPTTNPYKRRIAVPNRNDAELHEWYKLSRTLYNSESKAEYIRKINEKEATLFAAREAEWEAQFGQSLEDNFTAEQIARYEKIKAAYENADQKLKVLQEAETLVANAQKEATQTRNEFVTNGTPEAIKAQANQETIQVINFSELQQIAYIPSSGSTELQVSLTRNQRRVIEEAYRSAYGNESAFAAEAQRLLAQQKENDRRNLFTDSGIKEPVMTATVRNFLEDQDGTIAAKQREIAKIRKGIPKLQELYADRPGFLATQIKNAEAKIAALERYITNGQQEVVQYQADLLAFNQKHAASIAAIDKRLSDEYAQIASAIPTYFAKAKELVAQRSEQREAELIQELNEHRAQVVHVETLEEAMVAERERREAQDVLVQNNQNLVENSALKSQKELEQSEFDHWAQDQLSEKEQIKSDIIANLKAGRAPYSVLVADIGVGGGILSVKQMQEFGARNEIWMMENSLKYGDTMKSIIEGSYTISDFSDEGEITELKNLAKELLDNRSEESLWLASLNDLGQSISNLTDFVDSAELKLVQIAEAIPVSEVSGNNISKQTASAIAHAVGNPEQLLVEGFERQEASLYGLKEFNLVDPQTGLKAGIYSDGQKTVLAFSGSGLNIEDWVTNMGQGFGFKTGQYEGLVNILDSINNNIGNQELIITGHSLGGGLAATAGAITGAPTYTFNAAGVHANTLANAQLTTNDFSNITNYITRGDILTRFQLKFDLAPDALGRQVYDGGDWSYAFLPDKLSALKGTIDHITY